jgi:phage terminase large subunit
LITRRIVIPYTPRALFRPYHQRTQRWACLVCHRRMGKTVAAINDKVRRAVRLTLHDGRFAYVAPQLNQAKDVAWNYLKRYTEPLLIEKNEAELWVEIPNAAGHRSRIRIYGADNPDRLRGGYLDGVTPDEYADMAPSVWGEIIRPMLADRRGWATFIGTLKGRNHLWKLYEDHKDDPEWFTMLAKASETGIIPAEELAALRADMTPEEYEQEFECNPDAAIRGAYFGKELATAQEAGRIGNVPWDDAVPVHTAWDLGVGDATAIWFFQIVGAEIHVIDHYEAHGHGLPHYAQVLASKPYKYGRHYLPHDARARDLGTGRTRVETFQKLTGAAPWVLRPNNVMDGINAARMTLVRCWFDAVNCADGLEALRQYRADFDEKARTFKDAPRHDWTSHSADAFRYLAMAWRELKPEVKPPEPQWFTRGVGSAIQVNIGAITQRHHARRRREDD